jgi:hypothetical protein
MWRCHGSANLRFAGSIPKAGFNVKKRNDSYLPALSAFVGSVPFSSLKGLMFDFLANGRYFGVRRAHGCLKFFPSRTD